MELSRFLFEEVQNEVKVPNLDFTKENKKLTQKTNFILDFTKTEIPSLSNNIKKEKERNYRTCSRK